MEIYIEESYDKLSGKSAGIIADLIKQKPECVLGLATGSTALGTYKLLIKKYQAGEIKFSLATTFNLDDYVGLSHENSQSYHYFMKVNLFDGIDIDIKKAFFPNDFGPNYKGYDKKIEEAGGIDLQILGIGRNGHIGFNEPGSSFSSKTREVKLSQTTIEDNARFFNNIKEVPITAATAGMDTIMRAKKIILLANGENKSQAIFDALYGPVSEKVPASILQRHKNVIVILDKEAASKIPK